MALAYYEKYAVETVSAYTGTYTYSTDSVWGGASIAGYPTFVCDTSGFSNSGVYAEYTDGTYVTLYTAISADELWELIVTSWDGTSYSGTTNIYTADTAITDVKGAYIDTLQAELGTYPADGISGAYWYVYIGLVPSIITGVRVGGAWKPIAGTWVRVGGAWKQVVNEWVRVSGVWKQG